MSFTGTSNATKPLHERLSVGIDDAATLTGLSRSRLYELLSEGRIRSVAIGRRRLIPVASLRELIGEAA
jgi:excisionase family DNA binding protein